MVTALRGFFASAAAVALLPLCLTAQQPAVVTGHVTGEGGRPIANASVAIQQLGVGSNTRDDGTYTILVPAARVTGEQVTLTVRAINYKPQTAQVTLSQGQITQDFSLAANPLQLGEVVVTGAGTTSEVEKLGTVRNYVDSSAIVHSQEQNVVNALAAKAPNVQVFSSSGDPGASSYIQIRGLTTIQAGDGQPLFVVDGIPVGNSTDYSNASQLALNGGTTFPPNRLLDINPDDIENVEILKGASSGAIYGSRAGQGVVLITTKHGRPGQTRYSLRSSWSLDQHTQLPALQRSFDHGVGGVLPACVPGPNSPVPDPNNLNCAATGSSWGPPIAAGTPTFDHAGEIFQDGYTTDNALSVSGGTERTQYFLSGGYSYDRGIVVGDNNHYRRISVRANGSQGITDKLKVGANVAYSSGSGGFVQSRNSTAGLLLGAWRTTPTFNNLPYLDPEFGLQRSYRFPNPGPGSEQVGRIYDNPFFTANANPATTDVARTFGNITAEWSAFRWLKLNENLGYDYSNDERFQSWAWSNSNGAPPAGVLGVGGVNAGYIRNTQIDNTLTATASYTLSPAFKGTITAGQDLNSRTFQDRETLGAFLITPQPFNLANTSTVDLPTNDQYTKIHTESYFGQITADLWEQFFLQGAVRNDGASSFGAASRHNWFPKASASWLFYGRGGQGGEGRFLSYGKLRAAYGQSGTQPPPYLLGGTFVSQPLNDGGWGPISSTQIAGLGGLITNFNLPTQILGPERVKEFEAGVDLGFWGDKADLSVTHYRQNSDDVILQIPVAVSTGYFNVAANAASLQNRGWEVTLNLRPINAKSFGWDLGFQWARNRGITTALAPGLQFYAFPFSGGGNGAGLAVGGVAQPGVPIAAYRGTDFVRCGRGLVSDEGVDIDHTAGYCQGKPAGALYIGQDGFPQIDLNNTYILGDPNPDWTGSVRTNFRLGKVSIGGLLDVRAGGIAYDGTKGALQNFGTAQITADTRTAAPVAFGSGYYPVTGNADEFVNPTHSVAGPGVGLKVPLDQSWWQGLASVFNGPDAAFLEPGHFVKLREVSLGYTFDQPWVGRSLGFSSIELRVAGRNLHSWNDYTGVDPETSLLGAVSPVRGLNYFNNPQSRSWTFSLTLNR
jgi:TonB-linked SusC/RagA family outer membrane protein